MLKIPCARKYRGLDASLVVARIKFWWTDDEIARFMYSILVHPMMHNIGASNRARQRRRGGMFCSADLPKLMLVVACLRCCCCCPPRAAALPAFTHSCHRRYLHPTPWRCSSSSAATPCCSRNSGGIVGDASR
ncbi:hypothetical protein ACQ4PT_021046 [Festuca glaucescens]